MKFVSFLFLYLFLWNIIINLLIFLLNTVFDIFVHDETKIQQSKFDWNSLYHSGIKDFVNFTKIISFLFHSMFIIHHIPRTFGNYTYESKFSYELFRRRKITFLWSSRHIDRNTSFIWKYKSFSKGQFWMSLGKPCINC